MNGSAISKLGDMRREGCQAETEGARVQAEIGQAAARPTVADSVGELLDDWQIRDPR